MFDEKKKPNYTRRRLVLGSGLAAVALAYPVINSIEETAHIRNEANTFSVAHLSDNLKESKIDPATITTYTIQSQDINPIQVANQLGAKDTMTVADEISGQVGGADSMEPGETVVLPNDQLNPPSHVAEK